MKYFFLGLFILMLSCKENKDKSQDSINSLTDKTFNDSEYVLDPSYPKGDVRRYGIYPDSVFSKNHPYTNKAKIETVLDFAEKHGVELTFPKGYYDISLIFKGRRNIVAAFNEASFGGAIQVLNNDSIKSENIELKGDISTYDSFFSRESENIIIGNLKILSNPTKSIYKTRAKGCQIYAGTKDIKIKNLYVEDLGSDNESFKYKSAALSIEGWNNNPENVQIKKIHIKSTDRHGIYITGKDHLIGDVVIDRFGMGSSVDMAPMQDAQKGEEKDFKALWVNKCYDSFIENITIDEKNSKGEYTAHFDYGDPKRPFTIGRFKVLNDNPDIGLLKENPNGVIIEIMD